jgi:ArsR family transcriptional regulator
MLAGMDAAVAPASPSLLVADLAACCSPITGTVLEVDAAERLADVLKALAEPTRLRLLSMIAARADAESCVCDLTAPIGLSQPTVSHHLKILVDSGLLEREQRGKWAYFSLKRDAVEKLAAVADLKGACC